VRGLGAGCSEGCCRCGGASPHAAMQRGGSCGASRRFRRVVFDRERGPRPAAGARGTAEATRDEERGHLPRPATSLVLRPLFLHRVYGCLACSAAGGTRNAPRGPVAGMRGNRPRGPAGRLGQGAHRSQSSNKADPSRRHQSKPGTACARELPRVAASRRERKIGLLEVGLGVSALTNVELLMNRLGGGACCAWQPAASAKSSSAAAPRANGAILLCGDGWMCSFM
jgi:hypothetical protein